MPTIETERKSLEDMPEAVEGLSGKWLQVLSHIDPKFGGLSAAVPKLAHCLVKQCGIGSSVAAFCEPEERSDQITAPDVDLTLWPRSRKHWLLNSDLRQRFKSEITDAVGVHIHGLWELSTMAAAAEARRSEVPYVLSPHGMLEPWALANKGLKKRIYSSLVERRTVEAAACLIALTEAEATDIRAFGYKGPIAIIPNGVDAPPDVTPELFLHRFPHVRGKRILLFLGRIHYKKGIDLLLKAWSHLAESHPDVVLVVAGPDSEGSLARMRDILNKEVASRALFTGMLEGSLKWSALAASDFFVLPSYSEGLSVAALEALSLGVPVIVSDRCNLPQVPQAGAGWQTTANVEALTQVLHEAITTDMSKCAEMRFHARALAQSEFSWKRVTHLTAAVYRWLEGGERPADVKFL